MIITRYLVWETLKSQLAIIFILLFVFFCQKLVRILGAAVDGNIPTNLVLSLLGLAIPKMAQLILPLSLFLGLLMTLSRMHTESEITAMHACGLGPGILIRSTLVLSLITTLVAAVNVMWCAPWSERYQNWVMSDAKANPGMTMPVEKQFKLTKNGNSVLFIGNVKEKEFKNVFLAQVNQNRSWNLPSIIIAERGHMMQQKDGSQVLKLDRGIYYEQIAPLHDFCITSFTQYQAVIAHRAATTGRTSAEQMPLDQLWRSKELSTRAELHWRFALLTSVLIMGIIAVPLAVVNPRQGRMLSTLPAMLLYLIFFLLQTSLRTNGINGTCDPMLWVWLINAVYFALGLILNLRDGVQAKRAYGYLNRKRGKLIV